MPSKLFSLLHAGDMANIKEYVQTNPTCLGERNTSQDTVLHVAVQYRNNDVLLRFLLAQGLHVDVLQDDGWTPLHVASSIGFVNNIKILLQGGADPNASTWLGSSPLDLACSKGFNGVIRLLIQHGATTYRKQRNCSEPYYQYTQSLLHLLAMCPARPGHRKRKRRSVREIERLPIDVLRMLKQFLI
jgi:ankyrin repeat protein